VRRVLSRSRRKRRRRWNEDRKDDLGGAEEGVSEETEEGEDMQPLDRSHNQYTYSI